LRFEHAELYIDMKLTRARSIIILSMILSAAGFCVPSLAQDDVQIEFERGGITASLVNKEDYYVRPDGRKVRFYRKKDVYVIEQKEGADRVKAERLMQRARAQFDGRVTEVKEHQLGRLDVVRFDNSRSTKRNKKQAFDIEPDMVQKLDSSIANLKPVFTMQNGDADLLLLPKVTLELNQLETNENALKELKRKYNLRVIRKLKLSGDVFSLAFLNVTLSPGVQFAQVRSIMSEPFVAWAEPEFYVKPKREAFTPNDA